MPPITPAQYAAALRVLADFRKNNGVHAVLALESAIRVVEAFTSENSAVVVALTASNLLIDAPDAASAPAAAPAVAPAPAAAPAPVRVAAPAGSPPRISALNGDTIMHMCMDLLEENKHIIYQFLNDGSDHREKYNKMINDLRDSVSTVHKIAHDYPSAADGLMDLHKILESIHALEDLMHTHRYPPWAIATVVTCRTRVMHACHALLRQN